MNPPSISEIMPLTIAEISMSRLSMSDDNDTCRKLVALGCEMVGSGIDGMLGLCGRVCPVKKMSSSKLTRRTEDHMIDAMPIMEVGEMVRKILGNGEESIWRMKTDGWKACLLKGHDLEHDLRVLQTKYPENLQRYEVQSCSPCVLAVAAMRLYKRVAFSSASN